MQSFLYCSPLPPFSLLPLLFHGLILPRSLTPWHPEMDTTGFTAYAFYDPDASSGVLLAFRQEKCREASLSLSLPFSLRHAQMAYSFAFSH